MSKVCECGSREVYMGVGSSTSYEHCARCGGVDKAYHEHKMKIKSEIEDLSQKISELEKQTRELKDKKTSLERSYRGY